jgi:hypothetical protein
VPLDLDLDLDIHSDTRLSLPSWPAIRRLSLSFIRSSVRSFTHPSTAHSLSHSLNLLHDYDDVSFTGSGRDLPILRWELTENVEWAANNQDSEPDFAPCTAFHDQLTEHIEVTKIE